MKDSVSDIIGKKVNMLTIICEPHKNSLTKKHMVLVECDCGVRKSMALYPVLNGICKSCGCLQRKGLVLRSTTHNLSKHPLSAIWRSMINRCNNKNNPNYKNYGGRGIKVCPQWNDDIISFVYWATTNGWIKGLHLDRLENDKGYSPVNCRFVTAAINNRNKRNAFYIVYNNQHIRLAELCDNMGLSYRVMYRKIKAGRTFEESVAASKN